MVQIGDHVRHFQPPMVLFGLLLSCASPVLTPGASTAGSATAGPGADGPDLSYANRPPPPAGVRDWSGVGYRGGQALPGDGDVTDDASCRITPEQLASRYQVIADDGADDTTGL